MKEIISTVTSKGQVTIPAEVREYLGIKTNDKISFVIDSQGTVRIKVPRYPDVASLRGAAGSLKKPLSWQQMLEIAYEDRLKEKMELQNSGILYSYDKGFDRVEGIIRREL